MGLLNLDGISLMAFSNADVIEAWKESVRETERQKTQRFVETRYSRTAHQNTYSRAAHTNVYSRVAHRNTYTRVASQDRYTRSAHVNTYSRTASRDSYTRVAHTNRYTRVAHTNRYSEVARRNSYSETAHRNRYTRSAHTDRYTNRTGTTSYSRRYTNVSHRNSARTYGRYDATYTRRRGRTGNSGDGHYRGYYKYSKDYTQRAYRNSYTDRYYRYAYRQYYYRIAHRNRYSRTAHTNRYTRVAHTNSYSRTAARDSYSQTAKRDSYSNVSHRNVYSRAAERNSYTNVAARNTYAQTVHTNRYSRVDVRDTYTKAAAYSKGFDHVNYIPTAPDLYQIDGKVISSDTLEVRLASYDKNNDGEGSQDQNSKDIYYKVKIRQVADLLGNEVSEEWKVIHEASMTEDFDFNIAEYEDGIYEVSTQAYNLPRTENNVTKTYVSDERIHTFTIVDASVGSDLTIANAPEFMEYIYGIETYANREDEIKRYVDSIIYENSDNQKGLFLEIDLKDEDPDTYHKVKAGLKAPDGTVIASGYDVVFETDNDGTPIPGDKMGVVFIPLDDMLDNGSFTNVSITLDVTEFADVDMSQQIGKTERVIGVSDARDIVYIDTDNANPTITMTEPSDRAKTAQTITVSYADVGTGLKEAFYQVVKAGETPDPEKWNAVDGDSATFTLNVEGEYDVYAKTVDRAGNENAKSEKGYKIYSATQKISVPPSVYQGSVFDVDGETTIGTPIKEAKFWIQDYTDKVDGTKTGVTDDEPPVTGYTAELTAPTDIPLGTHVVFFEITCEDGMVYVVSDTIRVVRMGESVSSGPRYINGDFVDLLDPSSIWVENSEYRDALKESLENESPEEYKIGGSSEE